MTAGIQEKVADIWFIQCPFSHNRLIKCKCWKCIAQSCGFFPHSVRLLREECWAG